MIFPLVLYSVIFVIYTAFYMHNVAVLKEAAYETAVYGSTLDMKQPEQAKQQLRLKYNNAIDGKTIAMEKPNAKIEFVNHQIIVRVSAKMKKAPILVLHNLGGVVTVEKSAESIDPIKQVRLNRILENVKR